MESTEGEADGARADECYVGHYGYEERRLRSMESTLRAGGVGSYSRGRGRIAPRC